MLKNTKAVIENYLNNTFNNVALRVGKGDKIIGEIYLSTDGEINEKTVFDMASVTKILATSTLTHIAFSDGLLSPQTLVSDFFNIPPDKQGLKIHHLLTHTIGFGHINLTAPQNNYQNTAEYILNIEGIGVGKEVIYSCPAFILMGKILEKVYNKPLDVLFLEKVAKPLDYLDGLNVLAKFGLPIEITEITVPTFGESEEDEQLQADLLALWYATFFSHPAVDGLVYWNTVDGHAYTGNPNWIENNCQGGLFHKDLTPKKSALMMKKLFNEIWHTDLELLTNENGEVNFRGFYGDYSCELDGQKIEFSIHKNQENKFLF